MARTGGNIKTVEENTATILSKQICNIYILPLRYDGILSFVSAFLATQNAVLLSGWPDDLEWIHTMWS